MEFLLVSHPWPERGENGQHGAEEVALFYTKLRHMIVD
jgi:hypothetical protein